jgi:Predicted hydrolase of the metallo-beta-lactamase superfamily
VHYRDVHVHRQHHDVVDGRQEQLLHLEHEFIHGPELSATPHRPPLVFRQHPEPADTGALAEAPDFLARGFAHDDTTFEPVIPVIEKTLATAADEGIGDAIQLEQLIARAVANWAFRTYRRRPLIIPVIIDA